MNDGAGDVGDASAVPAAGWYPDPVGRHEYRFHNGSTWTGDVADEGRRFVDPPGPIGAGTARTGQRTNRLAVAALVLGIVGIGLGVLPYLFVVGAAAAVVAIVFGVVGLRRSRPDGRRRAAALAGLVTGVAGILAAVVGGFLTVALDDAIDRFEEPGAHEVGPVSCEWDGEAWTASGSITNLEEDRRSYLLSVEFVRAGTDNARARVRVEVDDVESGDVGEFSVRRRIDLEDVDCVVSDVDGPAPFGLDLGG